MKHKLTPQPTLPTEPGTVIRIGDNVWLLDDKGDWHSSLNHNPDPEDADNWTVVYTLAFIEGKEEAEAFAEFTKLTSEDMAEYDEA